MELRLPGIGAGIFRNLIESGSQNKQVIPALIFDADIVLFHAAYRNFFNSPVDAYSVFFMDHIVPYADIRKIPDFLSFRRTAFLPSFFFSSFKNITL